MDQSSDSSVQTEIFSPENIRLHTKYTKRYTTGIMIFCFVVGTDLENAFEIEGYTGMSVSKLRDEIYEKNKNDFKNFDSNKLSLWKVDIPYETENDKLRKLQRKSRDIGEEHIIIQGFEGKKLSPVADISDLFTYDSKNIRIIVQPPPPATTASVSSMHIIPDEVKAEIKNKVIKAFPRVKISSIDELVKALALIWDVEAVKSDFPSSQNDPCVKLKMEPSFFKINLPSAITKQSTVLVDLCLPPYESESGMNYLNPFYDDPQFKETVSLVREKLIDNPRDIAVLAGVSGGGKTSTAFGIAMNDWSIYIDFSPSSGQYGDFVGQELEDIKANPPKFGATGKQKIVYDSLDLAIVSRGLLLIKMLVQGEISTPKEWLFAQLRIETRNFPSRLINNNIHISSLIDEINRCLNLKDLILIFDEAQVLCNTSKYGEYKGSSDDDKEWNLLQAYIEHLTHLHVTCLLAGTHMHMLSGIALVTSVGKAPQRSREHIVLKLPFLSHDDVLRNLDAVIDLRNVSSEIRNYLGHLLMGRPRNCASFVQMLISERVSSGRTKDREIRELIPLWYEKICKQMASYLKNACKYLGSNNHNPETAIIDVLRLNVFYNHKYTAAIELLQHSIIPCKSPDFITIVPGDEKISTIEINSSFESYLVSSIECYLKSKGKTLIETFIEENIIRLNNVSSIGNEFDAAFITAIIQKRGRIVRDELNKWKNGQQFDLPLWITSTMKFVTISNLSGSVPIEKYVRDTTYYDYAIQPEIYSGSDLVISLMDDEQNVVLLSASCTVSGSYIERDKVKSQLIKSCMKYQYMERTRKREGSETTKSSSYKKRPRLQIGYGASLNKDDLKKDVMEEDVMEEDDLEEDDLEDMEEDDLEEDDLEEDDLEEDDMEEDDMEEDEKKYRRDLNFGGADYDLNYTENTKNYRVSNISKRKKKHEEIKTLRDNKKHIYVSVELPRRRGKKRPELFRFNEYGDLVIIIDDRNMEHVFGPSIKKLVDNLRERSNKNQD